MPETRSPRKLTDKMYQQELIAIGSELSEIAKVILNDKSKDAKTFTIPFSGGSLKCHFQKSNSVYYFEFRRQASRAKSGSNQHILEFEICAPNGGVTNPRVDGNESAFDESCWSGFLLTLQQVKTVLLSEVRKIEEKQKTRLVKDIENARKALRACLSKPIATKSPR